MSARDDIADRIPGGDAGLIVAALLVIYVAYVLAGVGLGFTLRGQLNTIATLTFFIGVFAMLSLALNLHWGYTGLFNIGVVGFMAVGIYVMALFAKPVFQPGSAAQVGGLGLPIAVGIVAGMVAAAVLGLVVALPALRLRADYLAIVTIAMSEIVRFSFLSGELAQFQLFGRRVGFGGGAGIILDYTDPLEAFLGFVGLWDAYLGFVDAFRVIVPNNPKPVVDGLVYGTVLLVFVALYYWLLKRTGESPFGRVLKAIREDEEVTQSLGKDTRLFKIKAFMIGCALMGLAGVLFRGQAGYISPNQFRPVITFYVFAALIVGGSGSNTGSVLGAATFTAFLFYLPARIGQRVSVGTEVPGNILAAVAGFASFDPTPFLAYVLANVSDLRFVAIGVVLVYIIQNRPEGLLGHRIEPAASVSLERPGEGGGGDDE